MQKKCQVDVKVGRIKLNLYFLASVMPLVSVTFGDFHISSTGVVEVTLINKKKKNKTKKFTNEEKNLFTGAFFIPFLLILLVMGLPLFFLELIVGQYTGLGATVVYARMAPIFQGLGYCTIVVITFVTIYYMVIIAWMMFYFFASFSKNLAWSLCDNDFNTPSKFNNDFFYR